MNELTIEGKLYISSKKAAEITGYAKDYVGQLCREGHVDARMVGRSWYVLESSIRAHRFGGDPHAVPVEAAPAVTPEPAALDTWERPTYVPEMVPSMPVLPATEPAEEAGETTTAETLTDMQTAWKEWFAQKQDTFIETPEIIDAREEEHNEMLAEEAREDEIQQNIQAFKDAHEDIEAAQHIEVPAEQELEAVSIHAIQPEPIAEASRYEEIEPESEPVAIHHAPEPVAMAYEREEVVPTKQERRRAAVQARKERMRSKKGTGSFVLQAALVAVIVLVAVVTAIGTGYASKYVASNSITQPVFDFLGGTSTYTK